MNNRTLYLLVLNMFLCTANMYGMETELEQIASKKDMQQLLQTLTEEVAIGSTNKITDEYDLEYAKQTKEHILQAHINKRKWCNLLYGATTLAMMGVDIANSYWDEKGLLIQKTTDWGYYGHPCECPNQTSYCQIKDYYQSYYHECMQTSDSMILYIVNDGTTMYRFYAGFANLYHLYQVQQALNERTADETTELISHGWCLGQSLNSGAMGIIAGVAGIVNGIKNYPRTIAVWSLNAAVDAVGAFNWHQNRNACNEIMKPDPIAHDIISIGSDSSDTL